MDIVQYIPDSFQEYEGEHALVLFCSGCNLACPGCYNYVEVTRGPVIGNARELIDVHLSPLHTAVVFLGGEPTIWDNHLVKACMHAKEKGLKVKVYTNGQKPEVVSFLLSMKLVDAWSVDFKAVRDVSQIIGKAISDECYVKKVHETLRAIQTLGGIMEVRTTMFPGVREQWDMIKKEVEQYGVRHIPQEDFQDWKQ